MVTQTQTQYFRSKFDLTQLSENKREKRLVIFRLNLEFGTISLKFNGYSFVHKILLHSFFNRTIFSSRPGFCLPFSRYIRIEKNIISLVILFLAMFFLKHEMTENINIRKVKNKRTIHFLVQNSTYPHIHVKIKRQ